MIKFILPLLLLAGTSFAGFNDGKTTIDNASIPVTSTCTGCGPIPVTPQLPLAALVSCTSLTAATAWNTRWIDAYTDVVWVGTGTLGTTNTAYIMFNVNGNVTTVAQAGAISGGMTVSSYVSPQPFEIQAGATGATLFYAGSAAMGVHLCWRVGKPHP